MPAGYPSTWHFLPDGSGIYTLDNYGNRITSSIDELTGGRWRQEGPAIRDTRTGAYVWNLTLHNDPLLAVIGDDRYMFLNQHPPGDFNHVGGRSSYTIGAFNFTHTTPDGTTRDIEAEGVGLAPIGSQLFYNPQLQGREAWAEVPYGPDGAEIRAYLTGNGYRLATFEEAAQRSIAAWLLRYLDDPDRRYRELLDDIVAEGTWDDVLGKLIETTSEAAMYLARLNTDSMEMYIGGFRTTTLVV